MTANELIELLARMTTPYDGITDDEERDDIAAELDDETLCDCAATLYSLIEEARKIKA